MRKEGYKFKGHYKIMDVVLWETKDISLRLKRKL